MRFKQPAYTVGQRHKITELMHDRSRTSSLLYKSTIANMTDCGHLVIELRSKDFQIRVRLRHVSQIRPILAPARIVSTSSNATASREAIKGEETHHREKRSAEREPQLLAFLPRHELLFCRRPY